AGYIPEPRIGFSPEPGPGGPPAFRAFPGGTAMRIPEARRPGPRLTRYARWLGLDRNPLRRRTDRIEAVMRLATVILFLVAVPLVCIAVAQLAAHLAQRQAHAQAAAE